MQLEKIEKFDENLEYNDEHIINMWRPFNFKIKKNYKYIRKDILFKIFSKILYFIIVPLVYIYNKLVFGFKIYGIDNLKKIKKGKITVSNHIHPMDCTMNAIANFPRSLYFPTLKSNFEIPVIRHLIRLLLAFPIPDKTSQKEDFLKAIYETLDDNKTIHFYPEGSLWPYYKGLRKFKNGAFDIAVEKDISIIPVVFKFVKPYGIRKYIKKKPCINLYILEPIYSNKDLAKKEAVHDLRKKVYLKMNEILDA